MKYIGRDPKEQIISRFSNHVSSGKAEFFKSVGIDLPTLLSFPQALADMPLLFWHSFQS